MKTVSQIVLGLFLISLISCESSEQATTAFGDAFIITKSTEQDTLYGLALHAFSNKNFQSVSASPAESVDVSYDLSMKVYQNNFYYETSSANFGTESPQTGEYNFAGVVEGNEDIAFLDNLTDDIIYPPVYVTLEYNTTEEQIDIEWEEDTDVDIYVFSMTDENDQTVFISNGISGEATEFKIDKDTYGWASGVTPEAGTTYTILFEAYLYEATKTDMNLQCKSMITREVTWGE
ncbi:hypothetical protein ACUNWD_15965 [Sunxiuqinia sp. A32]|uniref:hypothetical protein n=1 Tax=Sunxiuqinia sp. A32 TaxID=3461496 RepID=UPI0040460F87